MVPVCLLLWAVTMNDWTEIISMAACALTAYLLVELNITFTLIRAQTVFPACLYVFFCTACFFLHPFRPLAAIPPLFLLALFFLFKSCDSSSAAIDIFNAFFCLGVGSLLFPQLLFFVPLFYWGMIHFRSLAPKSFFAGLIGLALPYWFLFGHAFYHDQMALFYRPWQELLSFRGYPAWNRERIVSGAVVTLLSLASIIRYFHVFLSDKVRTRLFLFFLITTEAWIYVLGIWQPRHFDVWLSLQIAVGSILAGHLFVLMRTRFSGIFFLVSFILFLLLAAHNLWMQFFNF